MLPNYSTTWTTVLFCAVLVILQGGFGNCEVCHVDVEEDGGWTTRPEDRIAQPGPCNIEVVDKELSFKGFIDEFAFTKPVVLRHVTNNKKFKCLTKRSALLDRYGHTTVRLSSANSYSYDKRDITFDTYCTNHIHPQKPSTLGNETFYFFGDNNHEEWQDLMELYQKPPFGLPGHSPALSFGVADLEPNDSNTHLLPFPLPLLHLTNPHLTSVVFQREDLSYLTPPSPSPSKAKCPPTQRVKILPAFPSALYLNPHCLYNIVNCVLCSFVKL
ncbi:jmjC domain-containing protein 8-like isoform X2 [Oratosquilla oratoria]|uniref:jmjC domain-containing protein 8-like isoform X2 n=1 Tax=Oratosquilla oratoria TaxID=337810 RepID=UPI003F763B20